MAGATIGIASQYFGDPISCEFQGISSDLAQDYCWIHGSSYIPPQYQAHMKCIVDQYDRQGKRFKSADDAPDTSYYQWVVFVFAFQAAIFYLPFKLWTVLEANLVASFGTDGKSPVMLSEDAKYDDGVVQEAVIEKFVKYYKAIFHHNSWYFANFVMCELLNFVLLFAQFQMTDNFLSKKFRWYGWEAFEYYYFYSEEERRSPELGLKNPMCRVFPTVTSCNLPNVGAGGGEQVHNGLCVLTQNIINEKIFLILWWWYAILAPISIAFFFYRLCTIILTVFGSVCCTRRCGASTTTTSGNVWSTFSARVRLETGLSSTNFARTATPTSSGNSSESLPLSSDIAQREASPVHIQLETREP
jgi:hypothetical protein